MIDVINLQRKVKLDISVFREFTASVIATVPESNTKTFSLAFVSDDRMRQLNETFRGKHFTTDVLSFPWSEPPAEAGASLTTSSCDVANDSEFLGDIVISAEQARKQAAENDLTLENEIKQLILHGLLHLCGYDHAADNGEMNARELELRDKLGIS